MWFLGVALDCTRTFQLVIYLHIVLGWNSMVVAENLLTGNQGGLLWSSTGGGWRAMFADVGFANLFRQVGLMDEESTQFDGVSTVSGASWFSSQLFYSQEFYNQAVLAETPEELESFVLQWMGTYSKLSGDITDETKATCDTSDLYTPEANEQYAIESNPYEIVRDICELLVEYQYDWALFVQAMLNASSTAYGDPGFINTIANSKNKIEPLQTTDLLIQAALMPNSRIRHDNNTASTAVYLGYNDTTNQKQELFTVALSAAWVAGDEISDFWYGTDDMVPSNELQTYLAPTPTKHSWETWEPFFLFPGENGTVSIDGRQIFGGSDSENPKSSQDKRANAFQAPFGGPESTTVVQVAAISSAAAGGGSPLIPSAYTQSFSIGYHTIGEATVAWYWRIIVGVLSGLAATAFFGWLGYYCTNKCQEWRRENTKEEEDGPSNVEISTIEARMPDNSNEDEDENANNEGRTSKLPLKVAIASGTCCGAIVGSIIGILFGVGSILVPTAYDYGVRRVYTNPNFDKFAVCSQWPNSCGPQDAQMIDGYFVDNPAVVMNVGHYLQKNGVDANETLKLIITNTNQYWDNEFNIGQILQYFSTTFNQDVDPGDFLWNPGLTVPYRSPQIFYEYLDADGLNNALVSIPDSNMTTATFKATTLENPSFGVSAGQPVDILLLNLNADITTYVVGKTIVDSLTQPLADMTIHVAFNAELFDRVQTFITDGVLVDSNVTA